MNKLDNILKKVLFNMSYDSKKTLSENKIIILEEETISEMSFDGSSLDLSVNVTNVSYINDCDYNEDSPVRTQFCEWAINKKITGLPYKTVDECYTMLLESTKKLCKVGGVFSFDYSGHTFTPCVRYHDGKKPYNLPDIVKFSGYFDVTTNNGTKGSCGSLQYHPDMFEEQNDKKNETDNQDATPNIDTKTIDTKKQSSGEVSSPTNSLNVVVIDDI